MAGSIVSLVHTSQINKVRFSVYGDEENLATSSAEITSYDLFHNNKPHDGGLADGHMGTIDHNVKCLTCRNDKKNCPGHDGHLKVNYPVIQAMVANEIKKWLKVTCFECGAIVVNKSKFINLPRRDRLNEAAKSARNIDLRCPRPACKQPHPQIVKEKKGKDENDMFIFTLKYYENKKEVKKDKLYAKRMKEILSRISDEDVVMMGKHPSSHPKKFIVDVIKVLAPAARPDVKKISSGKGSNDPLTTMYQHIVKSNDAIPTVLSEAMDPKTESLLLELNRSYFSLIKGGTMGSKKIPGASNGDAGASIKQRLKGKEGEFRRNLMGKRVQGCCRSTIVGDPTLKLNEIRIPMRFAKNIQVEETIQPFSRERCMIYFMNGRKRYPGCSKIIEKSTGIERGIEHLKKDFALSNGDIIFRDLIDGDVVNFNRQPTLLLSNMTCMNIVINRDHRSLVIGMNPVIAVLFNADFDGD